MAAQSYIYIFDTSGNRQAVLTPFARDGGYNGFLLLSWLKRVNDVSMAQFTIDADNPDAAYIIDKYGIEIWREDTAKGLALYKSFEGEIRDDIIEIDNDGRKTLTVRAFGPNALLARRHILYPANTSGKTTFASTPAESVMKTLVTYNATASATTANGRDRTASTLGITVQADAASGNVIDWNCGGRTNLLAELQKIAAIAGGDFDLVKTGIGAYNFRFYAGQLGTDRTSGINKLVFSLDRGNMARPRLSRIRSTEKTVVAVGGSGSESARIIRVRTGANYSAANDIETYVDGRNGQTNAFLDETGDQALADVELRNVLEYDVLQAPNYTVENDYFLGDLALAEFNGISLTQQVYEIAFEYTDNGEAVTVTMRDL